MSERWRDEVDDVANTTCPACGVYVPRGEDGQLEEHQRWTDDGHAVTCSGTAASLRDPAVTRDAPARRCDGWAAPGEARPDPGASGTNAQHGRR